MEENDTGRSLTSELFGKELPPVFSRKYNGDILSVWDFVSSFERIFNRFEDITSLPSLDSLQDSIDALGSDTGESSVANNQRRNDAILLLTNVAMALCKPLAADLTKILSSVTTSAGPVPAQDKTSFDMTTYLAQNGVKVPDSVDTLPVTNFTWSEIARLSLMEDMLTGFGFNKQECAHTLRGFRSGGHPNSKEAKRLRRGEDFALCVLRQEMSDNGKRLHTSRGGSKQSGGLKVKMTAPCKPSALPTDWTFYLHNIKGLPPNAATAIKTNARKALSLLKLKMGTKDESKQMELIASELQKNLAVFEQIGTTFSSSTETINACNRARQNMLKVLDEYTGETFSVDSGGTVYREGFQFATRTSNTSSSKPPMQLCKIPRRRMGLIHSLLVSKEQYKEFGNERQNYIYAAQQQIEKKKCEASGEVEDDDDDDDEEEGDANDEKVNVVKQNIDAGEDAEPERSVAVPIETEGKIGKPTPHDDFCGDDRSFPEMIRRCLAVLRTVCLSTSAEPFLHPVDPQTTARYYELVVKPICLEDIGKSLQLAGKRLATFGITEIAEELTADARVEEIEAVVAQFARNVRHISHNCSCFSNVGAALISSADEMMRIFERLFFDWCLLPPVLLPGIESLDDDLCVDYHPSDEESMVLLCDGCEGKYNMSRLNPPLLEGKPSMGTVCLFHSLCFCASNSLDSHIGCIILLLFLQFQKATGIVLVVPLGGAGKTLTLG